jgi:hypothetical protein
MFRNFRVNGIEQLGEVMLAALALLAPVVAVALLLAA